MASETVSTDYGNFADLSDKYCKEWDFSGDLVSVSKEAIWYVSFKACGNDEHKESIHCTADCNSCLTNSCGYDCDVAVPYSVVCNACKNRCSALNSKYNGGYLKWQKDSAVTDASKCAYNPSSGALLNKCMKRMDVDGKNTAIFIQCDASTNYEWIWKDYMGLTFCDETPWKTSNSKDRETGAAKKCTSTSTSCNEKLVFVAEHRPTMYPTIITYQPTIHPVSIT
eukprot:137996_1